MPVILGGWGREGSLCPWNSEVDVWKLLAIGGPSPVLWAIRASPEMPSTVLDLILKESDRLSETAI